MTRASPVPDQQVAIILAAGRGSRLGGVAKALLTKDGRSYLACIREALASAGCQGPHRVVVGPPFSDDVSAEAERLGLRVVFNPAPERGMASSVALGFADLGSAEAEECTAALLWPVDHPAVEADTVARVCRRASRQTIVVPTHQGRGGHPPAIGTDLWPEMAACIDDPQGARSVIRRDPSRVVRLDVSDRGTLVDIDTLSDVQAVSK